MSRPPYYVLVCGGRTFDDFDFLKTTLHDKLVEVRGLDPARRMVVVHGDGRGADKMAGEWAKAWNVACFRIPAEWELWDKGAGFMRNQQMLDWLPIDEVIAFAGGPGTADMVARSKRAGVDYTHAQQDF